MWMACPCVNRYGRFPPCVWAGGSHWMAVLRGDVQKLIFTCRKRDKKYTMNGRSVSRERAHVHPPEKALGPVYKRQV